MKEMEERFTEIHRISNASFIRIAASLFAMPWMIGLGVMVTGFVIAGLVADMRFAVVGLLLLTVIAPMVLALLYFNYGLKRECAFNVMPHRTLLRQGYIVVEIFPSPRMKEENPEETEGEETEETSETVETPSPSPIGEIRFAAGEILSKRFDPEGITFLLGRSRPGGFLRLPKSACTPAVYDAFCAVD